MGFADAKYKKCPGCGEKKLLSGRHQEYNAIGKGGKQICTDCKINEIYNGVKNAG